MKKPPLVLWLGALFVLGVCNQAMAESSIVKSGATIVISLGVQNDALALSSDNTGAIVVEHNGEAKVFNGVVSIEVNDHGGDNTIGIRGLRLKGHLTIRSGDGKDTISFSYGHVGLDLKVVSGGGIDHVNLADVSVGGIAGLNTSDGDDSIELYNLSVEKSFYLMAGVGNDDIEIKVNPFARVNSIKQGFIYAGNGHDSVLLDGTRFIEPTRVFAGAGQDKIRLNKNEFRNALIVDTGPEDDELTATGNTVMGYTEINGDLGEADVYRQDEFNVYGKPYVFSGFEIDGPTIEVYEIGNTGPGGGIVFWLNSEGAGGLEAAPEDQGAGAVWGCTDPLSGADGLNIGDGKRNTGNILANCSKPTIAASIADDYTLGRYDDWYLPAKNELRAMLRQLTSQTPLPAGAAPMRLNERYWSSSQSDEYPDWAWVGLTVPRDGGLWTYNSFGDKDEQIAFVRPIRSFN